MAFMLLTIVLGLVVALAIVRGLLFLFVAWAYGDLLPHPLNESNPSHCDRCWQEASRRHALARSRRGR